MNPYTYNIIGAKYATILGMSDFCSAATGFTVVQQLIIVYFVCQHCQNAIYDWPADFED